MSLLNIRILTMNRPTSLKRLLSSLLSANFTNDTVNLEIIVDALPKNNKIDESTKDIITKYQWPHGKKNIIFKEANCGLKTQWLQEYIFSEPLLLLEDDLIVSPIFYTLIRDILLLKKKKAYLFKNIFGLSLQKLEIILKNDNCPYGKPDICLKKYVKAEQNFFLPIMSTWGPVVFGENFNELIKYATSFSKNFDTYPCIPGAVTNKWLGTSGTLMQYFFYIKNYFMMYFNIKDDLIFNYKEIGLHFNGKEKKRKIRLVHEKINLKINFKLFFDHGFNPINISKNFTFDQSIQLIKDNNKKCYVATDRFWNISRM